MGERGLRLRAADAEDLGVVAACLQDARVPIREMAYIAAERRFVAAFTRYRRERQPDPRSCEGLTEVLSALVFEGVDRVRWRGLDPGEPGRELALLTIATEPGRQHPLRIDLVFEGDARIRLSAAGIDARLDDFGEPCPCRVTPCDHGTDDALLPGWLDGYGRSA